MSTPPPSKNDRRSNTDRRDVVSRRRYADRRSIHLELCGSVLRVALVTEEAQDELPLIRTWTHRWRRDAESLMCEEGKAELSAALRQIVSQEKLAGCQASIAISSTLCVNRAASGPSAKVEDEIAAFEERSQLYLSLGPGLKTTAVGRRQIDARHVHALVSVANEQTLNLIVEAAESAGLAVDVVESSLVALSRIEGELSDDRDAVMVAQVDEDRFQVGVSRHGQLLLEYRPAADATLSEFGNVIEEHHDRMQRFCRRHYGVWEMRLDQLILAGDGPTIAAANQEGLTSVRSEAISLQAVVEKHWRIEENGDVGPEMASALGLALRHADTEAGNSPNLMEEIHARKRTPLRPLLMKSLAPVAAVLMISCGLIAINYHEQTQIAAKRTELAGLEPDALRSKQLGLKMRQADIEVQHLKALSTTARYTQLDPFMTSIATCLPDDVWLSHLTLDAGHAVHLKGASFTEGGVYDLVHHLQKSPVLDEVALRGTGIDQTPTGPVTSFEIDLTAPQAMLSRGGGSDE